MVINGYQSPFLNMEKAFVQVLKLRNTANWLFANSNYVLKRKNKDGKERKEKGNRKK